MDSARLDSGQVGSMCSIFLPQAKPHSSIHLSEWPMPFSLGSVVATASDGEKVSQARILWILSRGTFEMKVYGFYHRTTSRG